MYDRDAPPHTVTTFRLCIPTAVKLLSELLFSTGYCAVENSVCTFNFNSRSKIFYSNIGDGSSPYSNKWKAVCVTYSNIFIIIIQFLYILTWTLLDDWRSPRNTLSNLSSNTLKCIVITILHFPWNYLKNTRFGSYTRSLFPTSRHFQCLATTTYMVWWTSEWIFFSILFIISDDRICFSPLRSWNECFLYPPTMANSNFLCKYCYFFAILSFTVKGSWSAFRLEEYNPNICDYYVPRGYSVRITRNIYKEHSLQIEFLRDKGSWDTQVICCHILQYRIFSRNLILSDNLFKQC